MKLDHQIIELIKARNNVIYREAAKNNYNVSGFIADGHGVGTYRPRGGWPVNSRAVFSSHVYSALFTDELYRDAEGADISCMPGKK